jgi:transposase
MSTVDFRAVLNPFANRDELFQKTTELTARLKAAEHQAAALQAQNDRLIAEIAKLKPLKTENETLKGEVTRYSERVVLLEEELRWMRSQFYGSRSQKDLASDSPDQRLLFNEAEVLAAIEAADEAQRNRKTKVAAHERPHTGGRKAIPAHFPRVEIEHDLPQDQKMCMKCPVPHPLTRIGEETRECYRFEPPKISVEVHIRPTYVCDVRHEGVVTAPAPPVLLPRTMASPSLLAHLITAKFDDGIPLYRLARQLERSGMDLSPGTAGTWVNIVGRQKVAGLIARLNDHLFVNPWLQMDESYLQVLRSAKAATSDHYMVVRAAGPPGRRIILFDYIPSRNTEALKALLKRADGGYYTGKLLTDGLDHYDTISAALHLTHLGCNQHARAYFYKARKVSTSKSARSLAQVALDDYFKPIFAVEEEITTLRNEHAARGVAEPLDEIKVLRQTKSKPLFAAFKAWIELLAPATPPESALGKAFTYCANQWEKLVRHLEHPEVSAHNNYIEQQIKRYATGRKAWMFVYDKVGAEASANLFSLVMTARANDLDPFAYLSEVFEQLPRATTREALEALLPWNVKATLQARAATARAAIAIP